MTATLSSIAKQVGVDISLVSRVLRGDGAARISDVKRRQILEIAGREGYRPNRLGRSLRTGRTFVLGMLTPDITNPFHSMLFRGVEAVAVARGYNTVLCNTDDRPERCRDLVSVLTEGHIDGILVCSARAEDTSVEWLRRADVDYVLVNRRTEFLDDPWVGPDDFQVGRLGAAHLVGLGHRRIAFMLGNMAVWNHRQRLAGFLSVIDEHGISRDEISLGTDLADPKAYAAALLARPAEERPTALFTPQTHVSVDAAFAIFEARLRVPEEISIVGFSPRPEVNVTSIFPPVLEIGRIAAEYLIDVLEADGAGARPSPPNLAIKAELIDRGTTAAPAD